MGAQFDERASGGATTSAINGGQSNLLNMRDRALAGGAGAPSVSDIIRTGRQSGALSGGTGGQPGTFALTQDQVAQMRDAALRGQANPLFASIPGTGSGVPTIADIIRAQQARFTPYAT